MILNELVLDKPMLNEEFLNTSMLYELISDTLIINELFLNK